MRKFNVPKVGGRILMIEWIVAWAVAPAIAAWFFSWWWLAAYALVIPYIMWCPIWNEIGGDGNG